MKSVQAPLLLLLKRPKVPDSCFIHPGAIVEGHVEFGTDCSVFAGAVIRADCSAIRIGNGTIIQDGSIIHSRADWIKGISPIPTVIGDHVTIGHGVCVHAATIESHTLLGIRSTILDKAVIKTGTLVGAGALISPGKVADGGLWLGSPAKKFRELTDEEREEIKQSAFNYMALKNVHIDFHRKK